MAQPWKRLYCFLITGLLLLGGCAPAMRKAMQNEENKPGEEVLKRPEEENLSLTEQARVYPIELTPGRIWLVNRDGETVGAQSQSALIYDQLTRQPQYKVKTRRYLDGETDEYGQPVYTNQSALFSLEDECLADWDDVIYEGGAGRLVIRRDYADEFDR